MLYLPREAEMDQRTVEPSLTSKYEDLVEQKSDLGAVMKELEVVRAAVAEKKDLEGKNKSSSWELSSLQKQCEEADKNLMYARQRMREVKGHEAEARTKVT